MKLFLLQVYLNPQEEEADALDGVRVRVVPISRRTVRLRSPGAMIGGRGVLVGTAAAASDCLFQPNRFQAVIK